MDNDRPFGRLPGGWQRSLRHFRVWCWALCNSLMNLDDFLCLIVGLAEPLPINGVNIL